MLICPRKLVKIKKIIKNLPEYIENKSYFYKYRMIKLKYKELSDMLNFDDKIALMNGFQIQ